MGRRKRLKCLNICRNIWLDILGIYRINLLLFLFVDKVNVSTSFLFTGSRVRRQVVCICSIFLLCFMYMKIDHVHIVQISQ
jgi:hypothetical protein